MANDADVMRPHVMSHSRMVRSAAPGRGVGGPFDAPKLSSHDLRPAALSLRILYLYIPGSYGFCIGPVSGPGRRRIAPDWTLLFYQVLPRFMVTP
jgi:hypothetical protein